ncbi:MAG: MBOAT family protein [Cyanobacteria bacterium TGS_CYA1]|nr:MBOAT family protein [Cyanobacteria bacterium TGS_CYA1]
MLLLASYLFYMSWQPMFVFLIFGMTVFNWVLGNILSAAHEKKKLIFGFGITLNLLCLAIFKYSNLICSSLNSFSNTFFGKNPHWMSDIVLPLAISFFIFEFIHYLFEIYRGHEPIKSFTLFALFAAFFPTQIAGPIKRFPDFEVQMQEHKPFKLRYLDDGIPLIIIGFAKKILLADTLAQLVNMGYTIPNEFGSLELWLFAYAFAFQIYFDFSGYTDIARGSAMLFGYKIPINFNMPYIASNISNFWHRWHISLSTWLRDYLFIPLGGSRGNEFQTNRNLFITMVLGGLWHGASWNFVVWGIYHGLALAAHRTFLTFKKNFEWLDRFVSSKLGNLLSIVFTFHIVCMGWVLFRVQDIGVALNALKRMVLLSPIYSHTEVTIGQFLVLKQDLPVIIIISLILTLIMLFLNLPLSFLSERKIFRNCPPWLVGSFCCCLIVIMLIFLPDGTQPFIYFQF